MCHRLPSGFCNVALFVFAIVEAPGRPACCPAVSAPHTAFPDSSSFRGKCNVAINPYLFCVSLECERSVFSALRQQSCNFTKQHIFKAFCSFVRPFVFSVEDCNVAFVLFFVFSKKRTLAFPADAPYSFLLPKKAERSISILQSCRMYVLFLFLPLFSHIPIRKIPEPHR